METYLDSFTETFKQEAFENLDVLVQTLLELEKNPQDISLIDNAFRCLHTIKGSGSIFGFDEVTEFVHDIETVFDRLRSGATPVSKNIIDLTLSASDMIREMIHPSPDKTLNTDLKNRIMAQFHALIPEPDTAVSQPETQPEPEIKPLAPKTTYRIRFKPNREFFLNGSNPLLILRELQELGLTTIVCQTELIPPLETINPEYCYIYWDITLTTDQGLDAVKDVFIFVEDDCDIKIEEVDTPEDVDTDYKKIGEILIERGDIRPEDIAASVGKQRKVGEILVENGKAKPGIVASALAEQKHIRQIHHQHEAAETSIRVAAAKLDKLVDLVGELVTVQAQLSQAARIFEDMDVSLLSEEVQRLASELRDHSAAVKMVPAADRFAALLSEFSDIQSQFTEAAEAVADTNVPLIAEEVERLTSELRDNTMSIRMMPIGICFNRFKRTVRDLSQELGKTVDFITKGAETELDKTVIEKMTDPLTHLIRNCLDHGIETPEERRQKGKPAKGSIRLTALQTGGEVLIRIEDDGAGLNKEAIRKKALSKGLISETAVLSDKQLYELIFAPGFSTADRVTALSGRGVGMDVVKRNIENLRGEIDIASSPENGTSITLRLPLTLAIIDGLLTKTGETFFVVPLNIVEECIELTEKLKTDSHGRQIIHVRGEVVPYIHLRDLFGIPAGASSGELIVICLVDKKRVGFVVDTVVGKHQTVIKSLGRAYRDIEGLSGATILGDGTVALIVDPVKLAQVS